MNRWTKTKCQSACVAHAHIVQACNCTESDTSSTWRQAAPLKISQALVSVKCVTNETYYFLLKQRQISQSEFHVVVAFFLFYSRFIFLHFHCLFSGICVLDIERKHWNFFPPLYHCSFDEKTFFLHLFCFVVHVLFYTWAFFSFSTVFATTIKSFRSQWFWHACTNFKWKVVKLQPKRFFLAKIIKKDCDDWHLEKNNNNGISLYTHLEFARDMVNGLIFFPAIGVNKLVYDVTNNFWTGSFRIFINSMEFAVTLFNSNRKQDSRIFGGWE